jgi:hypothetical protein
LDEYPNGVKMRVLIAGVVGFLVPVGLGLLEMVLFAGKDAGLVHFTAYVLPNILCPAWLLGDGSAIWMLLIPIINALTYAAAVAAFFSLRHRASN